MKNLITYTSGKGCVIKSLQEETIATRNILIKLILYPVIDFRNKNSARTVNYLINKKLQNHDQKWLGLEINNFL